MESSPVMALYVLELDFGLVSNSFENQNQNQTEFLKKEFSFDFRFKEFFTF